MTTRRQYGHIDSMAGRRPLSELVIRLLPLDFVAHWGRCGMTADYMAHFFAYSFENTSVVQNMMSTILNELVENIVKFSADKRREVSITLSHYGETVTITTYNCATAVHADGLARLVQTLLSENLEELFKQQIEQTVATNRAVSGLGLLTLMRDYNARLGLRISPSENTELVDAVVQITLDVEELGETETAPKSERIKPTLRLEPIAIGNS